MSRIAALLAENEIAKQNNRKMRDDIIVESSYGTLPAYCKCKGFLDFVRNAQNQTVLKCRECGSEIDLD